MFYRANFILPIQVDYTLWTDGDTTVTHKLAPSGSMNSSSRHLALGQCFQG